MEKKKVSKKSKYVYRLLIQDQFGSWCTLCILRTSLACVAFVKTLCEVPYQPFKVLRHKYSDADFTSIHKFEDVTDTILRLVDKLFPLNSVSYEQRQD